MQRTTISILLSLICLIALTNFGCGNKPPSTTSTNGQTANVANRPSQLDNQQVLPVIRDIVAKILSIEPNAVDVNAPLSRQKIAADELDVVEIVMGVEEAFGVEIKDEEIADGKGEISVDLSVKKLAEIVSMKKARK